MDYTIITPTRDRPACMKMTERFIKRFTVQPKQWIVVDDGENQCDVDCSDYVRRTPSPEDVFTLRDNIFDGLDYVKCDKILVIEDDNWHSPDYAEYMLSKFENYKLIGEGNSMYYNVPHHCWLSMGNWKHAALCQSGFTRSAIPTVKIICRKPRRKLIYLDIDMWARMSPKKLMKPEIVRFVALRGLDCGRKGSSGAHTKEECSSFKDDPEYVFFNHLLGNDAKEFLHKCT